MLNKIQLKPINNTDSPVQSSPVWSPHSKQLITKIERYQIFSTKNIPGLRTPPYKSRLQKLGLETLEHRRLIHDLCLCYKTVHSFTRCIIPEFPVFTSSLTRGPTLHLCRVKCSTIHGLRFFINRIMKPWNSLPQISSAHRPVLDSELAHLPSISTNILQLNDSNFFLHHSTSIN